MNPFKSTSNLGKSLKKKTQHSSSSSDIASSSSSEVLTTAKTRVRKPFHQIYLEEISRKSISSTKVDEGGSQTSSKSGSKSMPNSPRVAANISRETTLSPLMQRALKIQNIDPKEVAFLKSSPKQVPKYFPLGSASVASFSPPKLPFCLRGSYPCECVPECNQTSSESSSKPKPLSRSAGSSPPLQSPSSLPPSRSASSLPPSRSASSSPPIHRKVSVVRKIFENVPTPATPVAHSSARSEAMTKVKDIIKQLAELTEPYIKAEKELSKVPKGHATDSKVSDTTVEDELCKSLKLLSLSSSDFKESKKQESSEKWKPISLSDVYKKGGFKMESSALEKKAETSTYQEFDRPLSLSELYERANLPFSSPSDLSLKKSSQDSKKIVKPLSTSNLEDAFESYEPLSIADIYKQANLSQEPLPSSSSDTGIKKESPKPKKTIRPKREVSVSQENIFKLLSEKLDQYSADSFGSKSCSDVTNVSEPRQKSPSRSRSPNCNVNFNSSSMPELKSGGKEFKPKEQQKLELDAEQTNYTDLSSIVTSKPKSIKSTWHELDITCFQNTLPSSIGLLAPLSSSGDFTSSRSVDLPLSSYCLPNADEKSLASGKETLTFEKTEVTNRSAKRKRSTTCAGEQPTPLTSKRSSEEIPKDLRDMFKKLGAIPKRAFSSQTELKSKSKKSADAQESPKIPLRKVSSFPLEEVPETQEVSDYRYKSKTELDLKGLKKTVSSLDVREKNGAVSSASEDESKPRQVSVPNDLSEVRKKYYPALPDYQAYVPRLELDGACGWSDVDPPEIDTPRAESMDDVEQPSTSIPVDPETVPILSTSKNGDENASSYFLPKYTFQSPQSGVFYAVEEWGEGEEDLPDLRLFDEDEPQAITRPPPNNDDGLDVIFGPLEDDDYYDCEDYQEAEEQEHFIDEYYEEPDEECLGQGGGADSPDLEFIFDDSDLHGNEIAELYSYTEQPELQLNVKAFEDQMEIYDLPPSWQRLSVEKRRSVVMKLLDQLESSRKPMRMRSARCLLYIAQGCWAEMQSDAEQQHWSRLNALLLYQLGAFSSFTDLLNIEIDNSTAAHVAMRKIAVSLADSQDLRVIISVLYIITEVIRNESLCEESEYKCEIEGFVFDIGNAHGDDHLVIKLLSMVTRFCSGAAPHFPMKKVLLLLWKLTLVSLGGMNTLKELKAEKRSRAKLPPQDEDTMEIAKTMRSSSPPASASDLLEAQNQKRSTRPFRRGLMKQSSLDDQESLVMEMETTMGNENGDDLADMTEYDERRPTDNSEASQMFNNHILNMYNMAVSPPPQHDIAPRGLPWKPKVRQKDIDAFLDASRQKFLGYTLPGDQTTLFGLPEPIHEGVRILKEHVYTSLAELQIQKEEEIARNPISTEEEDVDLTPAEILYQAMLPNLPQYMIALLKILLAAAPTSKAKTDSINIMADVLPEEMPMTVLQSMKLGIDVNRHKEIIVKAVSSILLLLLKHFKLNHIYQFEFMSQHLVFANCIPLVLKFFNQNIMAYVGAKNVIPILDFPSCVIGDQPELTAESLEIGDAAPFSWRNMFSCINLLRILNKLTKWKHSRIMMLVVFKSAPILKRTLKVRHAMTQLYVLKLLKMQTKYLGRQWRKSNMKTISAIYQKVRHRLNDDWAYGNDLDARPWDFQAEECALRASVDRFNNRRYTQVYDSEFIPVDNNPSSVLGQSHELSEEFKRHYSLWLEQEVYGDPIDWEKLFLEDGKKRDKDDRQDNK